MRKLIMWNIITLDGYFEGNQNWDLTFHNAVWGQELEKLSVEQLHSADYLVFGRVTYEGMAAYWTNTTLISENATDEIKKLKMKDGKDLYVFGSANLSETFISDNLFDEYRIGIAPVILGSGRPLFRQGISPKNLSLVSTHQLLTGGVILKYTI